MDKEIEIKIINSNGRGKNGKKHVYIRPDFECFNMSRKASGFDNRELNESINNVLRKWYQPKLFVYDIDNHVIVSNSEENALREYWRVCDRSVIGLNFPITYMTEKWQQNQTQGTSHHDKQ